MNNSPFQVQLLMTSILSFDNFCFNAATNRGLHSVMPLSGPWGQPHYNQLVFKGCTSKSNMIYLTATSKIFLSFTCVTVCLYICGDQKRARVSSTITVYPLKRGLPLKLGLMFSWQSLKTASPPNAPVCACKPSLQALLYYFAKDPTNRFTMTHLLNIHHSLVFIYGIWAVIC